MKGSLAFLGLAASAMAAPKGAAVTAVIKPDGSAPATCQNSLDGKFQISVVKVAAKRDIQKRDCSSANTLQVTLANGVLTDAHGRTGYIADNYQFQFDGPPQAGALYTAGFSACQNGSLALGSSTVFYQCLSGSFYNLYDRHWAAQCEPIEIVVMPCGGASNAGNAGNAGQGSKGGASQIPDGQVQAPSAPPVTQIGDGQIQAPTHIPVVTQIGDGQVQAPTGAPVSQIGDGQVQAPKGGAPVSQIGDGQVQAPKGGAPVTQIGDGQVQAPKGGAPVTQIGDGQVQAPTGAPVSQIGDGQVQAPKGGAPVTQISDGQVQAPTGAPVTQISDGQVQAPTGAPVTQISDGQIQAPTGTGAPIKPTSGPSQVPVTGAAASSLPASIAGLAAIMGAVLFL